MAGEPPEFIRMGGDRSIDWNLEEYSFQESSRDKVSWALKKSCSVGKKILITGFVLSSAPVVLPPLVVISAFGFVVSIPYGVFLASYACTEKIMSILLPNPSPPLLDYESESNEAVYLDEEFADYKDHIEQNYGFQHKVEMVEGNGYEEGIDECVEGENEIRPKENIDGKNVIEIKKEEPVIEKRKYDELLDNLQVDVVVVQGDEENEIDAESRETPIEVTTVVFEEKGGRERVSDIRDEEELLEETRGLLEKSRYEGKADNIPVANETQYQELFRGPVERKHVQTEKHPADIDGNVEEKGIRMVNNSSEVIQELEIVTEDRGNSTSISAEITLEARIANQIRQPSDAIEVGIEERDYSKPVQSENSIRGKKDDSRIKNIDKVDFATHYPHAGHETSEGYSYCKDEETVDFAELPVSSKPTKSEEVGLSSLVVIDAIESADLSVSAVTVESKVEANVPDKDYMVPSNEELYSDGKIREQIDSVKKIIGYKAAPHETCTEELNALYAFVGVEPPSSLRDPSDLNPVTEKLQFLMSIVGVK